MVVAPLVAALILVHRESETAGVIALLKRSFDYKRIGEKLWYVPIVLASGLLNFSTERVTIILSSFSRPPYFERPPGAVQKAHSNALHTCTVSRLVRLAGSEASARARRKAPWA
jgi:hypothetical protein